LFQKRFPIISDSGWEEEVLRKRFHLRKIIGAAAVTAGVLLIIIFVPPWVWYIILAALLVMFVYTLGCIYL